MGLKKYSIMHINSLSKQTFLLRVDNILKASLCAASLCAYRYSLCSSFAARLMGTVHPQKLVCTG
jgi:hypothetical protein